MPHENSRTRILAILPEENARSFFETVFAGTECELVTADSAETATALLSDVSSGLRENSRSCEDPDNSKQEGLDDFGIVFVSAAFDVRECDSMLQAALLYHDAQTVLVCEGDKDAENDVRFRLGFRQIMYMPVKEEDVLNLAADLLRDRRTSLEEYDLPRIMVVDDDPVVLSAMEELLDGMTETTVPVQSAEEALEMLNGEHFDILLADYVMEEMDGLEFFRRARMIRPSATFIMITAYSTKDAVIAALKEGVHNYIEKPVEATVLDSVVRKAWNAHRSVLERRKLLARLRQANSGLRHEIAVRRSAESALRESEERYRTLVESASDFIYVVDRDMKVKSLNESAARVLGCAEGEAIGRGIDELFHPEISERYCAALRGVFDTGRSHVNEAPMRVGDRQYWVSAALNPIYDRSGAVVAVLGISRDLTEQRKSREKLLHTETRMAGILESMTDLVFVFDENGRFTFCNAPEGTDVYLHDFMGKLHSEVMPPEVSDLFENALAENRAGRSTEYRYTLEMPEGKQWYSARLSPMIIDGKYTGSVAVARNITEIMDSSGRLRDAYSIINMSPAVAFLWKNQPGWPVEFVSENVMRLLGYSAEEFASGDVLYADLIHPEDIGRITADVRAYSTDRACSRFAHDPYRIVARDGEVRWVDDRTSIRRDENGEATHFQGVVEDISDRVNTIAALVDSEKRFRTILDNTIDGIVLADGESSLIRMCNVSFADMTGYSMRELHEMSVNEMHPEEAHGKVKDALDRLSAGKGARISDMPLKRRDGTCIPVDINAARVLLGGDDYFLGVVRDVSERKNLELHRQRMLDVERIASLGTMAAGIAHEIRQPLNALKITADGMLYQIEHGHDMDIDTVNAKLTRISSQCTRIDEIVTHMRSITRQNGEMTVVDVDAEACFENAMKLVGSQLANHGIVVVRNVAERVSSVRGDPLNMEQVFINLMGNAMNALDSIKMDDKRIRVGMTDEDDWVRISVSDNGPGLGDKIDHVFDPFFSVDSTEESMGIGLSIVNTFVASWGGKIRVEDNVDGGATFIIHLRASPGNKVAGEQA